MCRCELSAVNAYLMSVCLRSEWNGREELKKCTPPYPAVLWIVNVRERKPKKKKSTLWNINLEPSSLEHDTSALWATLSTKQACPSLVYHPTPTLAFPTFLKKKILISYIFSTNSSQLNPNGAHNMFVYKNKPCHHSGNCVISHYLKNVY